MPDLQTIIGIVVLLAIPVAWYLATPPEPAENVEARKRYGKVSKEEINSRINVR
jgi:hypothetical protein